MSTREWNNILSLIESDKIKDRVESVSLVRGYLGSRTNFNSLDADPNHSWKDSLQRLFGLVIKERNIVVVKPTSVGDKRLEDAAMLVAWLAEKVSAKLPKNGVKSLLEHLTQMIASVPPGQQQSFMLAYSKALRSLLGNQAHVEHLGKEKWAEVVMICFSVVLGDKVRAGQKLTDEEALGSPGDGFDDDGEDSDDHIQGPSHARQRRRGPNARRVVDSDDDNTSSSAPSSARRAATALEIELVGCIEALFRSKSAPFLNQAQVILVKFSRLFRQYSHETTAHESALVALNRAFAELDLNDQSMMGRLGVKLWSPILSLWATKNNTVKEQVVIALRQLLPFVGRGDRGSHQSRITALYGSVLMEPTIRTREPYRLDVDHIRLAPCNGPLDEPSPARPFEGRTIQIGHGFTDKDANAWAVLELGADALAKIFDVETAGSDQPVATSNRNGKRRRIEEPLSCLIDTLEDANEPSGSLAFRAQMATFFIERHPNLLNASMHRRMVTALASLFSHNDCDVRMWAVLALAAAAAIDPPIEQMPSHASPVRRKSAEPTLWDSIWSIAIRKLSSADVGRVSAHLSNTLLAHNRVARTLVSTTIESFAKDFDVVGPKFPSDAVCTFLRWCLALSTTETRLYRLRLPEKVLTWLVTTWKPFAGFSRTHTFGQSRLRSDPFSLSALVLLIARLCDIDEVPSFATEAVIPDCAIASMVVDHCETAVIRNFIDAKVAGSTEHQARMRVHVPSDSSATGGGSVVLDAQELRTERRISSWLQKSMAHVRTETEQESGQFWDSMEFDLTRRHLEFASFALNVESLFSLSKSISPNKATVRSATRILEHLAPSLGNSKWRPHERLLLLTALDSLYIPLEDDPPIRYPLLLDSGPASRIASHLTPTRPAKSLGVDFTSFDLRFLRHLWSNEMVRVALGEIASVLHTALTGIASFTDGNSNQASQYSTLTPSATQASQRLRGIAQSQREDNFGEIKISKQQAKQVLGLSSTSRFAKTCMRSYIKGLVSAEMATTGSAGSVRVNSLIEAIVNAPGTDAITIAEEVLNAVRVGVVDLGLSHAERVLQYLGEELLPNYQFARDERCALLGLKFLECTAKAWVLAEDGKATEGFGFRARMLCSWYTSNLYRQVLSSWRVRLRFLAFLDLYLSLDRTQLLWDKGGYAKRSADGSAILPTAIIPSLLADEDFRVRFRAATSAPALFTFMHENGLADDPLFADIRSTLELNMAETERILTQILSQANIMIVAASRRRAPYPLFLQQASDAPELLPRIVATLAGAAKKMGLGGLRDLYQLYARYNVYMLDKRGRLDDVGSLPHHVAGYPSLREARKADYRQIAGLLLVLPDGAGPFDTVCDVLQRPRGAVILDCFPQTVALLALRHAVQQIPPESRSPVDAMDGAMALIRELARETGAEDDHQVERLVLSVSDEIVAQILAEMYEAVWTQDLVDHVLGSVDKNACATFKELVGLPDAEIQLVETPPPHYRLVDIVTTTRWFEKQCHCFTRQASMLLVVHDLLARIHHAPFVDLQQALLMSLALALAFGRRAARDPRILDAVINALVELLLRPELLCPISKIIVWCFSQWIGNPKSVKTSGPALSAMATRTAQACHQIRNSGQVTEEALGVCDTLSTLLLRVLEALSEHHAAGANEAYLLWPTHLAEVDRMSLEAIGAVLSHSTTTISKFSIAQALADRPDFSRCPERGRILWRLLRSFKPAHIPTTADCAALADLLFQCSGEADAPGLDEIAPADCIETGLHDEPILNDAGVRSRILSEVMRTTQADGTRSVELAILSIGVARALLSVPSSSELTAAPTSSPNDSLVVDLSDAAVRQQHRLRTADQRQLAELDTDLWLHAAHDFEAWVKNFATLLADIRGIDEAFYAQLAPLLSADADFAAQIIPSLMLSVLIQSVQNGDGKPREQLSVYLRHVLSDRTTDKRCISLVVTVAIFLRRHPRPDLGAFSLARFDRWLEVPWILLAESAVSTGQYFNALLLLELAHEYDQLFQRRDTRLDSRGQSLLYDIYSEIDEPDGFYGRQSEDVMAALERRYHHENRWREAFALHGATFEASGGHSSSVSTGVLQSLASFGFNRLALSFWQPQALDGGPASIVDPSTTLSYELAWKTDMWDLPVDRKITSTSQAALYSTLRSIHTGHDAKLVDLTVTTSLEREVRKLSCVTLDHPQPKVGAIATILALREVKAAPFMQSADRLDPGRAQELDRLPSTFSLHNAEKVLSTRISLLRAIRNTEESNSVGDEFHSSLWRDVTQTERACLLKLSAVSRNSGHLQASLNAVTVASKLIESKRRSEAVDEELAMVLWAQGEHSTAISLLESVSNHRPAKVAIIRATLARWTMEARLKSSREILDNFFNPAVDLLNESYLATEKAQVYHAFADFADHQYQEMVLATKDRRHRFSLFEQRKNHEFEHIDRQLNGGGGSSGPSSAALRNARKTGEQTLSEDKHQLEEDLKATADMHRLALDNYAKSLAGSDEFDDDVLRFCALWLPCNNDVELNRYITPLLKLIPSHKFVFLVHQLSARLIHSTTDVSPFGSNVSSLVLRLCIDHPFHCLYAVNTLRDLRASQAPKASGRSRRGSTASSVDQNSYSSRAQAAEEVFEKVRRLPRTKAKADAIATVCDAYREWADFPLRDNPTYWINSATSGGRVKPGHLPINKSCRILTKVVNLPIPVTTFGLAVDPTCRYNVGTFPTIGKYLPTFTTAGGINLPKIVKCIGSDGKEFTQLLKGNDDIRQDAVMEQVFALCNNILRRDEATRRRKLLIRTYKVVPLQNATGLIEFVANTELLKTKLDQYYDRLRQKRDPGMITPREGSNELATVRGKAYMRCAAPPEINDQLAAKFREVLPRIPPMMRHVFLENHKVPSLWFEYRLNYSRSVATTSIIGYIVGLGDRHCSNLLMDKVRGEIVTIDLGIAFDQGKRLPIPETVPFRLTQNIVDGLGMSGVDGVFRRCSEETLQVLRSQSNVLLTVLEVLKHDPLQRWAVSAEAAKHIQQSDDIEGALLGNLPDDADRALAVVAQKLDDRLSVAYTVNELIQEATDPANLSRIFQGWQPFL